MPSSQEGKIDALAEVVHAALLTIAAGRPGPLWPILVGEVERRLGIASSASSSSQPSSESSRTLPPLSLEPETDVDPEDGFLAPPPPVSRAPAGDDAEEAGMDSLLDFMAEEERAGEPLPPPPPPAPLHRDDDSADFFDLSGPGEEPEPKIEPRVERHTTAASQKAAGSSRETALERQVAALRARVAELEADALRKAAEPVASTGRGAEDAIDLYFGSFGVTERRGADLERVKAHFELLARYFKKTRGNLEYLLSDKGFDVPIAIPPIATVMVSDLAEEGAFARHLEELRDCWKVIYREIWINLKLWCEEFAGRFAPEALEAEAKKEKKMSAWDVYADRIRRIDIYDSLMSTLRLRIKNALSQLSFRSE